MSKPLPKVILVGRKNVGKSTLFNRLSSKVKSITLDYEGVTRDFVTDTVCWQDVCFELIDSGGIRLKKEADAIAERVRKIGLSLIDQAATLIFVVDGTVGITAEDQALAKLIHKSGKSVILAVNKIDTKEAQAREFEFEKLGFKDSFGISAQHGLGTGELLEAIVKSLQGWQPGEVAQKPAYKMVLLGKPNVGKSSLLNLLLERERALVTPEPGTTREAIAEPIQFYQQTILLTDTPGVRRKRGVKEKLEELMVKSSFQAVENTDIVLLMIDGSAGELADQERKLAFYAWEKGKALIILVNKDDIIDEYAKDRLKYDFELYSNIITKVPVLHISCKTGYNIGKIMPLVQKVWQRYSQQFDDEEITDFFKTALHKKELFHGGERLELFRVKQVKTAPISFVMKVNQPDWFGPSQLAFFENRMRKKFDLLGVPVILIPRKKI